VAGASLKRGGEDVELELEAQGRKQPAPGLNCTDHEEQEQQSAAGWKGEAEGAVENERGEGKEQDEGDEFGGFLEEEAGADLFGEAPEALFEGAAG